MTDIEITWYLGRAIDDIRKVEEKLGNEEDATILRDIHIFTLVPEFLVPLRARFYKMDMVVTRLFPAKMSAEKSTLMKENMPS
jgi:hypothetical protein